MHESDENPFLRTSNRYHNWGYNTQPGFGVQGEIISISKQRQSTKWSNDPKAKPELDWWDPEQTRPKMQVIITLQTDLNEPNEKYETDDGVRGLVVEVNRKPGGLLPAITDAVKVAGGKLPEPGGFLQVWFTGLDPESANPQNPRKLFGANYRLPAGGAGVFGQEPQQQGFNPGPAQQPPPQQGNPYGQPQQGNPYGQPQPQPQPQPQQQQPSFNNGGYLPPGPQAQTSQPPQWQAPGANTYGAYQGPGAAQQPPQQGHNPGTGEVNPQVYPEPQQAAPPQQQQQQAGPPAGPDDVKRLLGQGMPEAQIAQQTGLPLDTVMAVKNFSQLQQPPY